MRKPLTLLVFLLLGTAALGQTKTTQKIKIALLGTIHFTPSTQDTYKNAAVDVDSDKRQK